MKFTRKDVQLLQDVHSMLLRGSSEAAVDFGKIVDKVADTFKQLKATTDLKFLHYREQIELPAYPKHILNLDRMLVDAPAVSFGWTKPDQGRVVVGFCKQNPKDNFSRKIARSVIEGRINHGDGYIIEVGENVSASVIQWAQKKGLI